jgi:hypothetical protein
MSLVIKAYAKLLLFDFHVARGGFPRIYRQLQATPIAPSAQTQNPVEQVCAALDLASIWYWKRVLCLQRSAVATTLLREFGVPADLVIGVQQVPFKAHAWVEVEGCPVNDKFYMAEIYTTVDRLSATTDVSA